MNTVTKWIPAECLETVRKRLAVANKAAEKLGAMPLVLVTLGSEERVIGRDRDAMGEVVDVTALFVEVEITGEIPTLEGGWKLLAVINHEEGVPIYKVVPGETLPERPATFGCDHCDTNRRRNDTFVVQDDLGELRQVGRNCLADFLGSATFSPENILGYLSGLEAASHSIDWDSSFGGGKVKVGVGTIVLAAAACVDAFGWTPRSKSGVDARATADDVMQYLFPPKYQDEGHKRFVEAIRAHFTPGLKDEAKAAVEWAKNLSAKETQNSEYLYNLKTVAHLEAVNADKLGIVASLIAAYRREQDSLRRFEAKARASGHLQAEVGQRLVLTVTLKEMRTFETVYGFSHKCELETEDGVVLVWWASNDPTIGPDAWAKGEKRTVKATVKKHDEWKGIKQTVVSRIARFTPKVKKSKKETVQS